MSDPATTAPGPFSDETLLRRFAGGREDALAELAARYEGPLFGLATALLDGRVELSRDAVQETWLRVIRSVRTSGAYAGRSTAKTWLYRILINRCHDLRREHGLAVEPPPAPPPPTPELALLNGERLSHVRRAVGHLPGDRRLLLLLCYHAGMSHAQAADILGIPVGTLKSRLNAALSELRTALGPEERP